MPKQLRRPLRRVLCNLVLIAGGVASLLMTDGAAAQDAAAPAAEPKTQVAPGPVTPASPASAPFAVAGAETPGPSIVPPTVVGVPAYARPGVCDVAQPDSVTLKQALQGTDFQPLSDARRAILDCLNQVQAVIIQAQKDLPAADSALERAVSDHRFFTEDPSPDDQIKSGDHRLKQIELEIQELEKQPKPVATNLAALPANGEDQVSPETEPQEQLAELKSEANYIKRRNSDLETQRDSYEKERQVVVSALAKAEALKARLNDNLSTASKDEQTARNLLDRVDDRIDQLLSVDATEGRYKLWLSVAFAVLIGVVIGGFFWLAKIDQVVRQQIFSGDAGLQFVTLFALVIAIILFGIVGILEGRELSALLGGISGYILGRTGSALASTNQTTTT